MLFQKPSLRTRVTFEAGMAQLGGHAIYLTHDVVLGARESVRDVARNLDRVVDAIVVRTGPHEVAMELAAQADIPVINGLTLREHPCQALADVFTIQERFGRLDGLVVTFVGDGNNVYHSLALLGRRWGWRVQLAHPPGYAPDPRIVGGPRSAATTGARTSSSDTTRSRLWRRGVSSIPMPGPPWAREAETEVRRDAFAATGWTTACSTPRARRPRHALPAGPSRRGDHVRGHGRTAQRHLRPVREPAARPEGASWWKSWPRRTALVSEAVYERYKDALRRGHAASCGSRFKQAMTHAASRPEIAPSGPYRRRVWPGCWHGPGVSAKPWRPTTSP